jgi:hypothetical protein
MYFIKRLRQAALGVAALFSIPYGKKIEKLFANIIDEKATIYDDKIDQFYNSTHIGGYTHRHFDGSPNYVKKDLLGLCINYLVKFKDEKNI